MPRKSYNEDQLKVLELLNHKEDVSLMVAPSFVVDFDYKKFVPLMKGLGFDYISELTFGAKTVNGEYHEFISKNKSIQKKFISSTCPMCVSIIKAKNHNMSFYLLPVVSPMVAMAKILRKNFPKNKIVFLSPCTAKKTEARNSKIIDASITFKEMKQIISKEKTKSKKCSHLFDRFYNDYTKIYPLAGGLTKTLNKQGILSEDEVCQKDGCIDFTSFFQKNPHKIFYDVLFCDGGCIGGNGVAARTPSFMRKYSVLSYRKQAKQEKIGKRKGVEKYTKGINFSTKF
jgi:iron only hydrogenase large subunit-like protein